jgi:hypothetical protein
MVAVVENKVVKLRLDGLVCDPVQYKPYSPSFSAQDVIVEIPLDSDLVEEDGNLTVLQLEGLQALMAKVANAVEEMHTARQDGQRRRHEGSFTSRRSS